jgi:hypothetical protein
MVNIDLISLPKRAGDPAANREGSRGSLLIIELLTGIGAILRDEILSAAR